MLFSVRHDHGSMEKAGKLGTFLQRKCVYSEGKICAFRGNVGTWWLYFHRHFRKLWKINALWEIDIFFYSRWVHSLSVFWLMTSETSSSPAATQIQNLQVMVWRIKLRTFCFKKEDQVDISMIWKQISHKRTKIKTGSIFSSRGCFDLIRETTCQVSLT